MLRNRQTQLRDLLGDLVDPAWSAVGYTKDYAAGHSVERHSHLRAQLLYASAGVMRVTADEGTWIVPPQQAVWLPAGTVHEVQAVGPLTMRSLYVDSQGADGLLGDCCVVSVSPLLRELIIRVVGFAFEGPPSAAQRRVLAVLTDELQALQPEPLHLPLPQDRRLKAITERLMADPSDGRPLADWARQAGASERTLARLFVKQAGLTFGTWRQRLRLLTAVARLAEGQAVTTVAYDLGYESPSAFIAMFRRSLGAPPGQYLRGGGPPNDGGNRAH